MPDDTKVTFIKYIHEHLLGRARDVTRVREYICPDCNTPVENRKALQARLAKGLEDIGCAICDFRIPLKDLIEEKFASDEFREKVRKLDERAGINIDNESRELILVGHAMAIAGEAGQIFRAATAADWGIDAEIEFKGYDGKPSGRRLYLKLKSGDSYLDHLEDWRRSKHPVMLVHRTSDGAIQWMDVSAYLKQEKKPVRQIPFAGEPFTALNLQRMRDRAIPPPNPRA